MLEVGFDAPPMRVRPETEQDLPPHLDQHARASGRHVEPAKQLLSRRLDCLLQEDQVRRGRFTAIGIGESAQHLGIGRELVDQELEEHAGRRALERLIGGERLACQSRAGNLAAFGHQGMAQRNRATCVAHRATRRRGARCAGAGAKQVPEGKRSLHRPSAVAPGLPPRGAGVPNHAARSSATSSEGRS